MADRVTPSQGVSGDSYNSVSLTPSSRIRQLFAARETGVFVALLLMCIILALATPVFLRIENLLNVGRQVSLLGIMAVGMTFVLISGEVDLSIGSTYALSGLCTGMLIVAGWDLIPSIAAGIVVGAGIGLVNGLLSTYGRLPSFITTLGMLSVARGVALLITNGQPVTVDARFGARPEVLEPFFFIGQGRVLNVIPMQLVFFVLIALLGAFLLSYTVFGFRIYAVGGSVKAARVSGIRVLNTKITAFVLMGSLTPCPASWGWRSYPKRASWSNRARARTGCDRSDDCRRRGAVRW